MARKATKKKVAGVRSAEEVAAELGKVRTEMAALKTLNDSLTKEFKKALIVEQLPFAGNYHITRATIFKVAIPELALPFAIERRLVKVDTALVHDVFKLDAELRFKDPGLYGFEVATQERVTPIGGRDEE